ncbi:hypothetical protein MIND_01118600 [Mycena indigotica]|uniref:Uncharacterized protein n=1 Tax=Mycena indigotica TaxID=2126181 RepID=A0A8H6VTK5_9AGAR|nr:uncharacterized protein MIND_01118600 [Mycena indigotica]KAF7293414.1 hypothetical protein MIND_01118600 [Mycena indigotica]
MQFTALFASLLVACAAGSASATTLKWHAGAGCTGAIIATQPAAKAGQCVLLAKGRTARSISFNGAKGIDFFESGGKHDNCANGEQASSKKNSGCVTAPAGPAISLAPLSISVVVQQLTERDMPLKDELRE